MHLTCLISSLLLIPYIKFSLLSIRERQSRLYMQRLGIDVGKTSFSLLINFKQTEVAGVEKFCLLDKTKYCAVSTEIKDNGVFFRYLECILKLVISHVTLIFCVQREPKATVGE